MSVNQITLIYKFDVYRGKFSEWPKVHATSFFFFIRRENVEIWEHILSRLQIQMKTPGSRKRLLVNVCDLYVLNEVVHIIHFYIFTSKTYSN